MNTQLNKKIGTGLIALFFAVSFIPAIAGAGQLLQQGTNCTITGQDFKTGGNLNAKGQGRKQGGAKGGGQGGSQGGSQDGTGDCSQD
ncbi:MAG: hypothetical protein WBM35_02660 [Candidatus Electrothrix sp.]